MFHKWFSGPANAEADDNPSAFWVDWDWIMRYERAWDAYEALTRKMMFNNNARVLLGKRLEKHRLLTDKREAFDFISVDWRTWKDCYNQYQVVDRATEADGLQVAMGAFTLRVLASGYTEPTDKGHRVYMLLWHQSLSMTGSLLRDSNHILVGIARKSDGISAWRVKTAFTIPTFALSVPAMEKATILWCFPAPI